MAVTQRVVVVGHGPIGHAFIEKLVERKAPFDVAVLCEEPRPAYNRVMLTQYFQDRDGDKHDQMKLSYWSEAQLQENRVQLVYGRGTAVDREAKRVTYTDKAGQQAQLPYDVLVLATGSYCMVPPIKGMTLPERRNAQWPDDPASRPEGVFVYRTIEDLEALLAAAKKGARRAAVIGGGLLGLEAAKAVHDLNMESHVLEGAPWLMPRQLNEPAGKVLAGKIADLGIHVHLSVKIEEVVLEGGRCVGIRLLGKGATEPVVIAVDLVVVSCGVRPRDELAKACGLQLGERTGGVKVDEGLRSSDSAVYALGEVASIGGAFVYGLWAPGVEQAEALARNLVEGPGAATYAASDLSTKLKLLGCDVASFGRDSGFWFNGQYDDKDPTLVGLECSDPFAGSYRKLWFSADGKRLIGGVLVGDAKDYSKLLQLSKKEDLGGQDPAGLTFRRPVPGEGGGAAVDGGDGTGLADDDVVCSCLTVTKGAIKAAIVEKDLSTLAQIKKCTKAGTGCGGCCTPVGDVPKVLEATLRGLGKSVASGICADFPFTRRELFDIVKVKQLKSFAAVAHAVGKGGGCEVCKPILASILAGLWNDHVLREGRDQIQDTNDRFLANVQKTGTYSVIPRCAGGDIAPEELIAIGQTAQKFGLWTKITGAQRLGLYGAPVHQLPAIWKELVDAGLESGHAYGKALRTVKSCVGTAWCRYGQQDAVTMAVTLENRYKGVRAPHKFKMAVSGCLRECAEAQGKDLGLIATQKGYNMYVCGNGGAKPKHAVLFASDIDEATCLRYSDRFLMFYISTAKHLQRTAPWLEELPGGVTYLQKVVIEDSLGICEDLEAMMEHNVGQYQCEWREVVYDADLQRKFQQFVNTTETHDSEQLEYIDARKQRHPATHDLPDIAGPALFLKEQAPKDWPWVPAGQVADYPRNGGLAVKHGRAEIAVFHLPDRPLEEGRWFAAQNSCPHKQARTISRGLLAERASGQVTLADPLYKTTYDLQTGFGLSHPDLNLSTFQVRVENGSVLVRLPPAEQLAEALEKQAAAAAAPCSAKTLDW